MVMLCCFTSYRGSCSFNSQHREAYFTVFSSLFFSLLLTHGQLISNVMTCFSSDWRFGHQVSYVSPLHALQALRRPNMLVRHPTRIKAWAWPESARVVRHLWVPDHAASYQKSTFRAESWREKCLLSASAPHSEKMRASLSGALLHN